MKGALPEVVDLARLKLWGCGGAGVEVGVEVGWGGLEDMVRGRV